MLKPTRAVLALAAGSLVLGLGGLGGAAAAADGGNGSSRDLRFVEPGRGSSGEYEGRHYTVGKVVSRGSLTVRSLPTTDSRSVGKVRSGHEVAILCKVKGQKVDGNDIWYRLLVEEHEDSQKHEKEDEKEEGGKDEEQQDERDEQDAQEEQDQREEGAGEDADEQTDEEAEGDVEDELAEDSDEEAGLSAKRASSSKESSKKAWVSARYVKNLDRVGSCD
ncbi:SH3 domain-containing protein [Streptomyces sp. NPDC047718]|uniref:SH3 domain-containing protein n=1 Tax=Streptomyces sp. NPDC047718 TaxID=3155479 RepID=UPI0033DD6CA8